MLSAPSVHVRPVSGAMCARRRWSGQRGDVHVREEHGGLLAYDEDTTVPLIEAADGVKGKYNPASAECRAIYAGPIYEGRFCHWE